MNIKEMCKELGISRATMYRRAEKAGIMIERDERGELTPDTVSMLGSLFTISAADTNTDTDSATGEGATDREGISNSAAGEYATGNTDSGEKSFSSTNDTTSAMLDRIHALEMECSRLTVERDAAKREADIWQEQAQQWREQATRSDVRIDRLLNAGTNAGNESPTFAEKLRRLFSRSGK